MTLTLGIANMIAAILVIGFSIPLTRDKIPMNQFYGVRIPAAFESDENWYKLNRYGGKCLIGWSVPVLIIGFALIVLHFKAPISPGNLLLVILFSSTPLLVVGALPQVLHWSKSQI